MKKHLIFTVAVLILTGNLLKAQEQTFTQMFDSVFQYVSRTDATTGILYNRVLPFSGFSTKYCNNDVNDTANSSLFFQAYMEMYNSSFLPTNALSFNNDSLEYLVNQNKNKQILTAKTTYKIKNFGLKMGSSIIQLKR
ncbi:hypothetical protein FACS1894178_1850 [Bacteroidia bacterium]|nr:hypothetical protein FACS1894178_1850 [Bacteroidia bacterium]